MRRWRSSRPAVGRSSGRLLEQVDRRWSGVGDASPELVEFVAAWLGAAFGDQVLVELSGANVIAVVAPVDDSDQTQARVDAGHGDVTVARVDQKVSTDPEVSGAVLGGGTRSGMAVTGWACSYAIFLMPSHAATIGEAL